MDCCCPANREPDYGVYVNNFQSTRISSAKNKFSFRTTAAVSEHQSKQSNRSEDFNSDRQGDFEDEIRQLEREYQMLKREEQEIQHFERNRVKQLEDEVSYYEREIQQRTKDIDDLHYLFRVKMEERRALAQRPQIIQVSNWNKNTVAVNDSTSYSEVQGNL